MGAGKIVNSGERRVISDRIAQNNNWKTKRTPFFNTHDVDNVSAKLLPYDI